MTSSLRAIETSGYPEIARPASFGKPARLEWLAIKQLVIDPEYQREISKRGRANIIRIAGEFDWSKFAPVIVAPAGSNLFAIVDGQHRATAAALLGLERVPCCIIDVARAAQAAAFAAINTVVTAMSTLQVHAAKLAAGDEQAKTLAAICARAGVSICRYPVPADKMKPGETLAAAQLYRFLARFGDATLVAALSCITRTGDGNVGLVRAPIIEALCAVLDAEPGWRDRAVDAMQSFDFATAFAGAAAKARASRHGIVRELIETIGDWISDRIEAEAIPRPIAQSKPGTQVKTVSAPRPVVEPKQAHPAVPPAPKPEAASEAISFAGGIVVELGEGIEAIEYQRKRKSLTWRQAEFFAALARGMPNPISRKFLCTKLFGGKGTDAQSDVQLDLLAADAKRIANAIGLDVKSMKGVGISLTIA